MYMLDGSEIIFFDFLMGDAGAICLGGGLALLATCSSNCPIAASIFSFSSALKSLDLIRAPKVIKSCSAVFLQPVR